MEYEILEHPSELRIRVYGKTLEELFSNAVLAMGEILYRNPNVPNRHPNVPNGEKVKIESVDLNSLLVDFLSEVLAKSQINKEVYGVGQIKIFPERAQRVEGLPYLEAQLFSHSVGHFDEDIKAVTYEDLDIKQINGIWQTIIVLDI